MEITSLRFRLSRTFVKLNFVYCPFVNIFEFKIPLQFIKNFQKGITTFDYDYDNKNYNYIHLVSKLLPENIKACININILFGNKLILVSFIKILISKAAVS